MLVLSRQRGETVMIGDEIEVTIIDVRGDKVRLGITAPRDVSVHRKEVYDTIRRQMANPDNAPPGENHPGECRPAPPPPTPGANPSPGTHPSPHGD